MHHAKDRTNTANTIPTLPADADQAGRTRDELAQDLADQIVANIRKLHGFIEDAEGGPLLRIAITNVDTENRVGTVLVGAPTSTKPAARHLTVVGGAR
jgi:hypothetical protein